MSTWICKQCMKDDPCFLVFKEEGDVPPSGCPFHTEQAAVAFWDKASKDVFTNVMEVMPPEEVSPSYIPVMGVNKKPCGYVHRIDEQTNEILMKITDPDTIQMLNQGGLASFSMSARGIP